MRGDKPLMPCFTTDVLGERIQEGNMKSVPQITLEFPADVLRGNPLKFEEKNRDNEQT